MNKESFKYAPWFFLASFVILLVSRKMDNSILLFPFWLKAVLFVSALPLAYIYIKKWAVFEAKNEKDKTMVNAVNGLCTVLLAFMILCLIKLPLNAVIKMQAKKNPVITQTCPITFYSTGIKNATKKHITFTFQEKSIRMKIKSIEMRKLKETPNTQQKQIILQLRKSILGTYVVEDYEIS